MKPMVAKIKAQIAMQEAHLALRVNSAAYNGDLFQLRDLIQAGADPNIKNFDGRSPLVCSFHLTLLDIVQVMFMYVKYLCIVFYVLCIMGRIWKADNVMGWVISP